MGAFWTLALRTTSLLMFREPIRLPSWERPILRETASRMPAGPVRGISSVLWRLPQTHGKLCCDKEPGRNSSKRKREGGAIPLPLRKGACKGEKSEKVFLQNRNSPLALETHSSWNRLVVFLVRKNRRNRKVIHELRGAGTSDL